MTFSLLVRDAATGAIGSVISSSSPAVAARCVHLADGSGGVHSQNVTDPRLGPRLLGLLAQGRSASDALATVRQQAPWLEWRQLLVVDTEGRTAIHSGREALGVVGEFAGEGAIAAGNLLATAEVPRALVRGWLESTGSIEERLLTALQAGAAEGGEAGPVHSAGLAVIDGCGWRVTDLRVDWSDDPIGELERVLEVWAPQRDAYVERALNPAGSPGYGVPGDNR